MGVYYVSFTASNLLNYALQATDPFRSTQSFTLNVFLF